MWLVLPPSTCSPCAPAPRCSTPDLTLPLAERLAQSATLSGKPSPAPSWRRAWKNKPWLRLLSGATCTPSTASLGVDSWISSLRATRASRSASPGSVVERTILATFGPQSLASLARLNPSAAGLKTSVDTSLWGSSRSEPTFKDWATALRRDSLQRRKSARLTSESGCSSLRWPTIRSEDAESCGQHPGAADALNKTAERWQTPTDLTFNTRKQVGAMEREALLPSQAETWPTPRTITGGAESGTRKQELGREESGGGDLQAAALAFLPASARPTPGANDHKGSAKEGQRRGQLDEAVEQKWCTPNTMGGGQTSRGPGRNDEPLIDGQAQAVTALSRPDPATSSLGAASSQNAPTSRPRLNPAFVEWLMGMPHGWTDFAPVGTEWSDWQRGMRSCLFSLVSDRSEAA